VNKTFNLIFMILMGLLAIREAYQMTQEGISATHLLFFAIFTAFTVRRVLIHRRLA
jgi:hypothetical protein